MHRCHVCQKLTNSRCSRCKSLHYCSPSCQTLDWVIHKFTCQVPDTEPELSQHKMDHVFLPLFFDSRINLDFQARTRISKESVLKLLKMNGEGLSSFPEFCGDKDCIIEAVKESFNEESDSCGFKYASAERKNDKSFIIELLKLERESMYSNISRILEHASDSIQDDEEVVLEAMKTSRLNFRFASKRLRNDKIFFLKAVNVGMSCEWSDHAYEQGNRDHISIIFHAGPEIRGSREFILEAIQENPGFMVAELPFCDPPLQDDKEVVIEAVKKNGMALNFASPAIQNDKEVVEIAIREESEYFKFASEELKSDRLFVIGLLDKQKWIGETSPILKYAKEELRDDEEVVAAAMKKSAGNLSIASPRLKNCCKFLLEYLIMMENVPEEDHCVDPFGVLEYAGEEVRENKEIVMRVVKNCTDNLGYVCKDLRDDKDVVLASVKSNGSSIEHASPRLRNDIDVVLAAVKEDGRSLKYLSEEMKNKKCVILECVKYNGYALEDVNEELRNDHNVIWTAFDEDQTSFRYVGEDFLKKENSRILYLLKEVMTSERGSQTTLENTFERMYTKYGSISKKRDRWEHVLKEKLKTVASKHSDFESFGMNEVIIPKTEESELEELSSLLRTKSFNDLYLIRYLGGGSYGHVYLCQVAGMNGIFAAKIYHPLMVNSKINDMAKNDSLRIPYHKNIAVVISRSDCEVDLRKAPDYETRWEMFGKDRFKSSILLMKYYRLSLGEYIYITNEHHSGCGEVGGLRWTLVTSISFQIYEGLRHLHSYMIVHRDLHVGNIFLDVESGRVWIGDFGCALDLRNNKTGFKVSKRKEILFSFSGSKIRLNIGGAIEMLPPEIRGSDAKDGFLDYEKCDIYSFGVLIELLSENICDECYVDEDWGKIRSLFSELAKKMKLEDPKERIGYDDVREGLLEVAKLHELLEKE